MAATNERFTFTGSHGEELAARLDLPIGKPKACALFAHCFTCSKDVLAASRIADEMTGHGIAVLRFDFTGLGKSDGEFSTTNFSSNVADLVKAADHMREALEAPQILIGHSLGGAAVLVAAEKIAEVKAVATIAMDGTKRPSSMISPTISLTFWVIRNGTLCDSRKPARRKKISEKEHIH